MVAGVGGIDRLWGPGVGFWAVINLFVVVNCLFPHALSFGNGKGKMGEFILNLLQFVLTCILLRCMGNIESPYATEVHMYMSSRV